MSTAPHGLAARVLACLCLLACCVATGCTSVVRGEPLAVSVEKRGPVGPVPAGLERFYGQTLGWGDCRSMATTENRQLLEQSGLECARMSAPLDYAEPDGRVISIALLRRVAGAPGRRVGSLVLNPGGPGSSGVTAAAGVAQSQANTELGARFDIVGFDPRGIGSSEPTVQCLTAQERDADRLDNDVDTSAAGVAQTEQENKRFAELCAQRTGPEVLANLGTRDVARDLDVLRSVLGEPKLTFLGFSYGTRIGTEYAERFPGNVRAMILDGAVDPSENAVDSSVSQSRGFQEAFTAFSANCVTRRECPLGTDPAEATRRFRELVDPLVATPAPTQRGRRLSYSDAITGVIQALYSEELWGPLTKGLTELAGGRGDLLLALADNYYGRSPDGTYSTITDAFMAVHCVDDERVRDRAVVAEADRRARQVAPFIDDGRAPTTALDVCNFWPVPPTSTPHEPSVPGLPTVLVISTTGDPATPYEAGVRLAEQLKARLLTNEGEGHTAFLGEKKCVNDIGLAYLTDLTLPDTNVRCA